MIRTFIFSDSLFQGYTIKLNIDHTYTHDKIIVQCLLRLKLILEQLNFEILLEKLEKKKFHIHNEISEIFSYPDRLTYICCCN